VEGHNDAYDAMDAKEEADENRVDEANPDDEEDK